MSREERFITSLFDWHKKNRRDFPWRDELDPYKIVVAEFFLQRTPVRRVAEIYPKFILSYPNVEALANANQCQLLKEYRRLGLAKRTKWLIDSMKIISANHTSEIPTTKGELMSLPGIGEYTASAILCFAFKKNVHIVDVNISRFYSRFFGIPRKEVPEKAKSIMPSENGKNYNEALLDYSSTICKKNPFCHKCIMKKECIYFLCTFID